MRRLVAITCLSAWVLSGCGSSVLTRDSRYTDRLDQLGVQFNTAVGQLEHGAHGRSRALRLAALGAFELSLANVQGGLHQLHPPFPASAAQRRVEKMIARYGSEMRQEVAQYAAGPRGRSARRRRPLAGSRFLADTRAFAARVDALFGTIDGRLSGVG